MNYVDEGHYKITIPELVLEIMQGKARITDHVEN